MIVSAHLPTSRSYAGRCDERDKVNENDLHNIFDPQLF